MGVAACAEEACGSMEMLDISHPPFGEVGFRHSLCCREGLCCHPQPGYCREAQGWLPVCLALWSVSLLEISVASSTHAIPE